MMVLSCMVLLSSYELLFFLQILINLEIYDRLVLTIKDPIFPFPASFTYETVVSMWLIHGLKINVDLRDKMMLITEDEKKKNETSTVYEIFSDWRQIS